MEEMLFVDDALRILANYYTCKRSLFLTRSALSQILMKGCDQTLVLALNGIRMYCLVLYGFYYIPDKLEANCNDLIQPFDSRLPTGVQQATVWGALKSKTFDIVLVYLFKKLRKFLCGLDNVPTKLISKFQCKFLYSCHTDFRNKHSAMLLNVYSNSAGGEIEFTK